MLLSIIAIACLLFLPALRKEANKATFQHNEGTVFGTLYHAKYLYDKDLKKEIEAELQKVDASLSMFNPQSTISRINRGETDETDEMLNEILKLSFTINSATNGAFDPTVAPLVNAWGFGFKSGTLPNSREVDSLRTLVGLSAIHLNKGKLTKDNPLSILDLSAIAKGYGVDRAAQVLRNHGIQHFMVEIGGEVVTEGCNEKGEHWHIGINKPDDDSTSTNKLLYQRRTKDSSHHQPQDRLPCTAGHPFKHSPRTHLRRSRRLRNSLYGPGHERSKTGAQ